MSDADLTAAADAGFGATEAEQLFRLYQSLDVDGNGDVEMDEVLAVLSKSTLSLRSDDDMSSWLEAADKDGDGKLDFSEFVRLYNKA